MGLTSNRPNCAKLWRCLISIALQTQVSLHCAIMKHQWSLYYLVTTRRRVASEQTRGRSVGSSDTWKALPTLSHMNDLSMTPCFLPQTLAIPSHCLQSQPSKEPTACGLCCPLPGWAPQAPLSPHTGDADWFTIPFSFSLFSTI